MTAHFEVRNLKNNRFIVSGEDSEGVGGTALIKSRAWGRVLDLRRAIVAQDAWNEGAEAFFAPLLELAKEVQSDSGPAHEIIRSGVEGVAEISIELDAGGVILQKIERGDVEDLVWFGDRLYVAD